MTENNLTRRKALKAILAAAGGVGASAFIPSKWLKPVVQSGVLPAHAQASGSIPYVDDMIFTGLINDEVDGVFNGTDYYFYLAYSSGSPNIGAVVSWEITSGTVAPLGTSGTLEVYELWSGNTAFRAGAYSISGAGGSSYGAVTFKFTFPGNYIVNASFTDFGSVAMGVFL